MGAIHLLLPHLLRDLRAIPLSYSRSYRPFPVSPRASTRDASPCTCKRPLGFIPIIIEASGESEEPLQRTTHRVQDQMKGSNKKEATCGHEAFLLQHLNLQEHNLQFVR